MCISNPLEGLLIIIAHRISLAKFQTSPQVYPTIVYMHAMEVRIVRPVWREKVGI